MVGDHQPAGDQLVVGLFGGLSVGGGLLGEGSRIPKSVWLIIALALFPDFRATDRQLEQLLFIEESLSFEDGGARLRQCVLSARKLLGTRHAIRRVLGSYVLEPSTLSIDIIEFERRADEALSSDELDCASTALDLYRNGGKLLEGHVFPSGMAHPNIDAVETRLRHKHGRLIAISGRTLTRKDFQNGAEPHPLAELLRTHGGTETHEVSNSWDKSILEILASANREIFIATDFAAYASFSKPDFFEKYFLLLNQKIKEPRVKVRVHIYDEPIRWILLRKQFTNRWKVHERAVGMGEPPAPDDFDVLPETPEQFKSLLDQFEARRRIRPTNTMKVFLDELVREDLEITAEFERCFNLTTGSARMPILMWIVDKKRAVFMSNESEIHFVSTDPRLVELLYSVGRSYGAGDDDRY